MKVFEKLAIIDKSIRTITIGRFDGVHKGHTILIEKVVSEARKNSTKATVITFNQLSMNIILKKNNTFLLSPDEKLNILANMKVDEVFDLEFNKNLLNTTCYDYLLNLKENLNMTHLILGFDAKLGCDQKNVEEIQELCKKINVSFTIIPELSINNIKISSTHIRSLISNGEVGNILLKNLGRQYKITGKVVHGKNIGKKIFNYPTANIELSLPYVIPKSGVYYCKLEIDDLIYNSAVNVGSNPTIDNNSKLKIEAFIFDFDKNIYGKNVALIFEKYIREEIKFTSYDDLKCQITKDVLKIKNLINKNM